MISIQIDRIFGTLYKKPTMSKETDQLRDQIEEMHLQILDLNESRTDMRNLIEGRDFQIKQLNQTLEEYRKVCLEQSAAVARCTSMEGELKKLQQSYDICEKNRQHVFELHKAKEAILQQAMVVTEQLRDKVKKGETAIGQTEHLARQVLRLNEENENLRKDYARMMGDFHEIKEQFPDLVEENNKFREQCSRLVQEMSQLECAGIKANRTDSLCGGCLACQLKQAQAILTQTADNFATANKERDQLKQRITDILQSHEENRKLVGALSNEISHHKKITRILREALNKVVESAIFWRKSAAQEGLHDHAKYLVDNKINWTV